MVFNFIATIFICCAVGILPTFLDQWSHITSNRFALNMVKGYHLQLRCHPPLFCNFRWFNIKATPVHHPIIQKEVDELLAKGCIEPSTVGADLYSQHICFFLNIWVAFIPYSTLSILFAIYTYLLLICYYQTGMATYSTGTLCFFC